VKELSFDWDVWNQQKNEVKHGISRAEAESVFFDPALSIFEDLKHSQQEKRWIAYGKSSYHQVLMIAFTVRNNKVRIISARKAAKKERSVYEDKTRKN
jgi:uncharacterized DUF497 family protein